MVVFRFHDHWHRTQPDGIHTGMLRKLGWEPFQIAPEEMVFKLPEQSVRALAAALEAHFETSTVRVVGAPDMTISLVGMAVGSPGSQAQIRMLRRDDVEVLITGETHEWETVEWTRDAIVQGRRKALILLGHADSEEAGMEYCAEWLRTFISEMPIEFIPAENPLWSPQ
jgi:putative NIF3 family GTP cyclohydrolase 1 type 2